MKLFIVERDTDGLFTLPDGSRVETWDTPPGAMWRCDCHEGHGWLIRLPGEMNAWCTLMTTRDGQPWDVSGDAPNLTVTPSIQIQGGDSWHGFITNGGLVGA